MFVHQLAGPKSITWSTQVLTRQLGNAVEIKPHLLPNPPFSHPNPLFSGNYPNGRKPLFQTSRY